MLCGDVDPPILPAAEYTVFYYLLRVYFEMIKAT